MYWKLLCGLAAGLALSLGAANADPEHEGDEADHAPVEVRLIMPKMDAVRGRELYESKGCVACHKVNGVGGEDASSLDAHGMDPYMNPFDLAARMWRMAPFMINAQEEAFGEQVEFDGDELSAIIAFLHDDNEQHKFTEGSLAPETIELMDHAHEGVTGEEAHAEELDHD